MMPRGNLTLVVGNMFSGKTKFLIDEIIPRLKNYAQKRFLVMKPERDTRSGKGKIKTKASKTDEPKSMDAVEVSSDNMSRILKVIAAAEENQGSKFQVLAFEEAQFFQGEREFYRLVWQLLRDGYDVIVAGLERDFRGEPFGPMSYLKLLVDNDKNIINLDSLTYCRKCNRPEAHYPQRLVDGKPAAYDSPQVFVGGEESYEPRCEECHEVPDRPRIRPS